jgi:vacuolar-type H+-ATPase subunit F/Vma7
MPEELSLDNPLAIVGEEDIVSGFRGLGFKVYVVNEQQALKSILPEIIENKIGICLVQDEIYSAGENEINSYKNLALPVFIPFSKTIQTDLLDGIIKKIRLRATGAF